MHINALNNYHTMKTKKSKSKTKKFGYSYKKIAPENKGKVFVLSDRKYVDKSEC